MESLFITSTEDTPEINFDYKSNNFVISERSLPENAIEFYEPVIVWLNDYILIPNEKTVFNCKLEYFNTASAKQLAKIILILEKLNQTKEVLVSWHYNIDDTDMYASGVRFSKLINIPFEFTELK